MEFLDLYDKERKRCAIMERGQKVPEGLYRLVIHICIFNSKGQLLIQQRSKDKNTWPNLWDITLGGCVQAGENSSQAATREISEELGLDINLTEERPLLTVYFKNGFDDYFVLQKDIDMDEISFKDHEVQAVKWANKKEVLKMITEGQFIDYYPSFIETLFDLREKIGVFQTEPSKHKKL